LRDLVDGCSGICTTDDEWRVLDTVVREWQRFDPDSIAFRYGVKKDGKTIIVNDDFAVDLVKFTGMMDTAIGFVDELRRQLDAERWHPIEDEILGR
jgi:hypothetical protein